MEAGVTLDMCCNDKGRKKVLGSGTNINTHHMVGVQSGQGP